jgi:hypothetical protein
MYNITTIWQLHPEGTWDMGDSKPMVGRKGVVVGGVTLVVCNNVEIEFLLNRDSLIEVLKWS